MTRVFHARSGPVSPGAADIRLYKTSGILLDRFDWKLASRESQVRVTSNPLAAEGEPEAELGTCFDNPNHIELPSAIQRPSGTSGAIDTTTYCKRDRIARNSFATKSAIKPPAVITPATTATTTTTTASMAAATMTTARNEYIFNYLLFIQRIRFMKVWRRRACFSRVVENVFHFFFFILSDISPQQI